MNPTKANTRTSKTETTLRNADVLSLRMYHLGKTLELAAFAAETRRVLVEVDNALFFRPEIKQILGESVFGFGEWKELEDSSGEVLRNLAQQVEQMNSEFIEAVYDMANSIE